MHSWGWRLPFLLALPVGAIGLYIRSRLDETPAFAEIEESEAKTRKPLRSLIGNRRGWKMIGRVVLVNLPCSVPGFLLLTFMPSFLIKSMGMSGGDSLLAVTLAVIVVLIFQPIGGMLSDRFGRRPILTLVAASQIVVAYPAFMIINKGGLLAATAGLTLIGITFALAVGSQAAPTLESFPTRIRFTGYAFTLGLTTALLAGPTPYIASWLVAATGSPLAPAGLMVAVATPALIGSFFFRETAGKPLGNDD
jgi:MHS family proline/betaine transporter-like MFS transporter